MVGRNKVDQEEKKQHTAGLRLIYEAKTLYHVKWYLIVFERIQVI